MLQLSVLEILQHTFHISPVFYPKLFLSRECSRFMCFKAELQIRFFSRAVNTRMFSNSFLLRWSWLTSQGHQFPTIFFKHKSKKSLSPAPYPVSLLLLYGSLLSWAVYYEPGLFHLLCCPLQALGADARIWGEGCGVPASVGRAVVSTEVLCGCWQMAQYDWLK